MICPGCGKVCATEMAVGGAVGLSTSDAREIQACLGYRARHLRSVPEIVTRRDVDKAMDEAGLRFVSRGEVESIGRRSAAEAAEDLAVKELERRRSSWKPRPVWARHGKARRGV